MCGFGVLFLTDAGRLIWEYLAWCAVLAVVGAADMFS